MPWPKEDRIRWVEWRIRERIAKELGRSDRDLDSEGIPDKNSLEVWLAKERDGLSWQQIAIKYFPQYGKSQRKSAGVSKARRAHGIVERAFSPTIQESVKYALDFRIRDVFGCTPEQFVKYLDLVKARKRRK